MTSAIKRETKRGREAASRLAEHLRRMESATMAQTIEVDGEKFTVIVGYGDLRAVLRKARPFVKAR